jgi:hypothetical protein
MADFDCGINARPERLSVKQACFVMKAFEKLEPLMTRMSRKPPSYPLYSIISG